MKSTPALLAHTCRTWLGLVLSVCITAMALAGKESDAAAEESVSPASPRRLHKEVTVAGTLEQVWRLWTTTDGISSFFAPQSTIEIRVGGPYELYMSNTAPAGKRGTEGCKVLSYVPLEMLSFEWNFPPSIPSLRDAGARTHVVLRFDETANGRIRIRLDQLGWGEGADWDEGFAYFDKAWGRVLERLQSRLEQNTDREGKSE